MHAGSRHSLLLGILCSGVLIGCSGAERGPGAKADAGKGREARTNQQGQDAATTTADGGATNTTGRDAGLKCGPLSACDCVTERSKLEALYRTCEWPVAGDVLSSKHCSGYDVIEIQQSGETASTSYYDADSGALLGALHVDTAGVTSCEGKIPAAGVCQPWLLPARDCGMDAGLDAGPDAGSDGGSDAGSDAGDADVDAGGLCSSVTVDNDATTVTTPGNVLMIFDRSGSMTMDWNGMPRWQAAGGAMISALTPVQDQLTIGAVFFPSDETLLSCVVAAITDTTQLSFRAGALALTQMQSGGVGGIAMYQPAAVGMTPTLEALQAADAALSAATLTGTTATILVTDGDPNCTWDQTAAINLVTAWAAKDIKTYVLGVPGVGGSGLVTLDAVAVAGGTTAYIAASDAAALQDAVRDIAEGTVSVRLDSCTIALAVAAAPAPDLHLVVTSGGLDYDAPHTFAGDATEAWTLGPDGQTVQVTGDLCTKLTGGGYENLRFELGCVNLPTLPKPVL